MENRDNGQKSSFRYLFVLYIVLCLLALPLSVLAIPNLKANLEETRFLEHYALWKDKESAKDVRSVKVVLSSYSGLVESERTIHTGYRDLLHYTLEALLLSETVEEKAKGFISLIPEGTTLIGAVVRDGIPFVTLSSQFLSCPDPEEASEQIEKTLSLNLGTKGLVIISEGEVVVRR